MQSLLAQMVAGKWLSFAAMSTTWQEATTSALATITISNNTILESLIPPAKDMVVDSISLDTTTISSSDTLPIYHADENGMPEGILSTSETKDELITSPATFVSTKKGEGTFNAKFLFCNRFWRETSLCQYCVGS